MPRNRDNTHSNATPNLDGELENVINDPTSTQSPQMGVIVNEEHNRNPFHLSNTKNKDMQEFEKLMKGTALNKRNVLGS